MIQNRLTVCTMLCGKPSIWPLPSPLMYIVLEFAGLASVGRNLTFYFIYFER